MLFFRSIKVLEVPSVGSSSSSSFGPSAYPAAKRQVNAQYWRLQFKRKILCGAAVLGHLLGQLIVTPARLRLNGQQSFFVSEMSRVQNKMCWGGGHNSTKVAFTLAILPSCIWVYWLLVRNRTQKYFWEKLHSYNLFGDSTLVQIFEKVQNWPDLAQQG